MLRNIDRSIDRFCQLFHAGVEAWVQAGALLTRMRQADPMIYSRIIAKLPFLTERKLELFEQIGSKQIHPHVLLSDSPGVKMLAALPYASQVKLLEAKVEVVKRSGDGFETKYKTVSELSKPETERVFSGNRLRTADEQIKSLKSHSPVRHPIYTAPRDTEEPSMDGDFHLDESPACELGQQLTIAQNALLAARTALAMIQRESRFDQHITAGLLAVSKLRYALAQGEIFAPIRPPTSSSETTAAA
jgi:hypothetical protein